MAMGHLAGPGEHQGSRAVLLGGELHGPCHRGGLQPLAPDPEMQVNRGEDLGWGFRALGLDIDFAAGNRMPATLEDVHDVHRLAATQAFQKQLHGPWSTIASADIGWSIDRQSVPTARFGLEGHAIKPAYMRLHRIPPISRPLHMGHALAHRVSIPSDVRTTENPSFRRQGGYMSPESVRFFQRPAIVELLRHCRRSRYRARSTVVHQGTSGDRLYLILRGSVSVVEEDENGRELILAYLNPGDFIGEMGLFGDAPRRSAWIRTRNTCELAEISYERFAWLQTAHPHILHPVVEQMTRRLRDTSRRFRDLAFEDVRGRVEATLRELAQQPDAMTHPEGMQLRITRIELGRLVGCSREMVGRVLRDMEADRLISARGRTIVVHEAR